jgi:glycosyltransferase involved in cell wall biosynthesis
MKVALVHDHLAQTGGAEKVLKVFADIFPEATIYTLLADKVKTDTYLEGRRIDTSVIQKLPGGVNHYKWYLPLMPMAVEFFDLSEYDLVISDTSSFAKGVITLPDVPHICYCHTPTRYLWSDAHSYLNELKYNKWLKKIIARVLVKLRQWDFLAASRVDYFVANSRTVAKRISKYYRRESQVIYPPVETDNFFVSDLSTQAPEERYFLAGCRLVPYKRIDLVVEAFKELGPDYRLKVFGDGLDLSRLKKIAGEAENIEFLGRVSDDQKAVYYSRAQAFINPQEEDFGITPLESMASGRPVIAYRKGGATETVKEGETGIFFDEQTPASLVAAVKSFRSENFSSAQIRTYAETFSVARFSEEIKKLVAAVMSKNNENSR